MHPIRILRTRPRGLASAFRRVSAPCLAAALVLVPGASAVLGQSDPLVSKTIPLLLGDESRLWAFALDFKYSVVDPFASPAAIRNGVLPRREGDGVRGGVGRSSSVLVFQNYRLSDTATAGGLVSLGRDGKSAMDSLVFQRTRSLNNDVTAGVGISALALWNDILVIGAGRAGFALGRVGPEGGKPLASDTLVFQALPSGLDTVAARLPCPAGKACRVDTLGALTAGFGDLDSVLALAVDSSASDSLWLLIGTRKGLRRGLIGGNRFPKVSLPREADTARTSIAGIHADPRNRILWVFSGTRAFFSDDHGRTFREPPEIPGVATRPAADLTAFEAAPEAVNVGDTSYVNFNLDDPGLVLFRRDSLIANKGSGAPFDVLLDPADGLDISRAQGKLTRLAVVRSGSSTAVAVGSTGRGLFYRVSGPGQGNAGEWVNVNSLKRLKGSLGEIITFPTVFQGVGKDGQPMYVNIGYRLKKDGKVTITVYNYAMEKVKTVVKGAPRKGGGSRSERPGEDRWDGRDRSGRLVSAGTYYILVESDQGEKGWGKAISARGRN